MSNWFRMGQVPMFHAGNSRCNLGSRRCVQTLEPCAEGGTAILFQILSYIGRNPWLHIRKVTYMLPINKPSFLPGGKRCGINRG
jgi:hypothetical protein